MSKSKRYSYSYEEYMENNKNAGTMLEDIMQDAEFSSLDEIVIGCWGETWEDSAQPLIDGMAAHKEQFSHIKSLFIGDMDFEDCEVSWIIQSDYSKLWDAMPQLEKLVIKGSTDLQLGAVKHRNLRHLEIICGGLGKNIFQELQKAELPNLETLILYIGIEDYGFDGDISTIKDFLAKSDFPKLTYLGLTDSEIQDDVAQAVLESKYMTQITVLDLSMGTLTDQGGQLLLDQLPEFPNIKELNLEYHYLSEDMMDKLEALEDIEVNVDDPQEADDYDGEAWLYPMLTE